MTSYRTLASESRVERVEFESHDFQKYAKSVKKLVKSITRLSKHQSLEGIGVSLAGYVDPTSGQVLSSYSFRDWDGKNLRKSLASFGCPVRIENDAVVAALGQYQLSGDQGMRVGSIYFAQDAGVGATVINPFEESLFVYPVELGHIVIVPDGRVCECGQKGCLEQYVAERGIRQTYGMGAEQIRDEEALITTARYLTQGIMTLLIFYPSDVLYLTGQNLEIQQPFLEQMAEYVTEMLERKFVAPKPNIKVAPMRADTIESGNLAQLAYGDKVVDIRYT